MTTDFSTVTELPGIRATSQQRSMLYTRYHLAKLHCVDKDVLEVACGAGLGLGYLARWARSVTGGDIDETNLNVARRSYRNCPQIQLHWQDAEHLEVPDGSFDTLLLFEAIYYLPDAKQFVSEARRVLRPDGKLIVCTVNHRWSGFNRSPHAVRYFDADELRSLLNQHGFAVQVFGGFPDRTDSAAKRLVSAIRSVAIRWRLIPQTMKGKQWLKRLFYGKLTALEAKVHEQMAALEPLVEVSPGSKTHPYKVLYAVAQRGNIAVGKFAA
ncbi:MAG TPA: class I SAM-dependent methyltransferase [Pirellulales bacterium]|nr:class I SAM-dependent methyltransferase [Pirellulales bacterium]